MTLRNIVLSLFMATALHINAVPVKPGLWVTLQLSHGKEVRAQLLGDEWFHYHVDKDGCYFIEKKNGLYKKVSKKKIEKLRKKSIKRRRNLR